MYMNTVGVAELRQNLSKYLKLVAAGDRLIVTDHNRPVAELGPLPDRQSRLERLVAAGIVTAPEGAELPEPISTSGGDSLLSDALDAVRGEG